MGGRDARGLFRRSPGHSPALEREDLRSLLNFFYGNDLTSELGMREEVQGDTGQRSARLQAGSHFRAFVLEASLESDRDTIGSKHVLSGSLAAFVPTFVLSACY